MTQSSTKKGEEAVRIKIIRDDITKQVDAADAELSTAFRSAARGDGQSATASISNAKDRLLMIKEIMNEMMKSE